MIAAGGTFLDTVREDGMSTVAPTGQATLCGKHRLKPVSQTGVRLRGVHVHVMEAEPSDWPVGSVLRARGRCWRRHFVDRDGRRRTTMIVERLETVW